MVGRGKMPRRRYKVCLTGKEGSGKTSIFNHIRGHAFSRYPKAEMDCYNHQVNVKIGENNTVPVTLQIWDTAGLERYESMTESYYKEASVIVTVFSLGCSDSFSYIHKTVHNIKTCDFSPNAVYFLVGNKTDLSETQVSEDRVYEYLNENSDTFAKFLKTSAKKGQGINELFEEIAYTLVTRHMAPVVERNLFQERIDQGNHRLHHCC